MSLQAVWLPRARADLINLPDWRLAEAVDAAVDRYAERGIGFILHVRTDEGPDEYSAPHPAHADIRDRATELLDALR